MIDVWIAISIFLGSTFMFFAAFGMFRMKNVYHRIHAPTKATTLGIFFLLLAVVLELHTPRVLIKGILGVLFFALTAPAAAHILARTAYRKGIPPDLETGKDEYYKVHKEDHFRPHRTPDRP